MVSLYIKYVVILRKIICVTVSAVIPEMTAFVFFRGTEYDYFSQLERKAEAP